jgi:predicted porin
MKRIILVMGVIALLAGKAYAEAPTEKGVYSLSGFVSYSHSKDNASGDTSKTTSLNPAGFYFVYPDLAIGTSIQYLDSKNSSFNMKQYGIGPVIRYYFGKETVHPFILLEYLYTKNKMTFPGSNEFKGRGNDLSFGIGVDYFLSKNVALEPIVQYTFSHADNHSSISGTSSSRRSEDFFIGLGINVFIF